MNTQTTAVLSLSALKQEASITLEDNDYLPLSLVSNHHAAQTSRTVVIAREDNSCMADVIFDGSTGQLMSLALVLYNAKPSTVPLQREGLNNIGKGAPCFHVDPILPIGHTDRIHGPLTLHVSANRVELIWSNSHLDCIAGADDMQWLFSNEQWCGLSVALSSEAQRQAIFESLS